MIITKEIKIAGMRCDHCESIVESFVKQMEGILFVKVDYSTSSFKVTFDSNKTTLAAIENLCRSHGYSFHPLSFLKRVQSFLPLAIILLLLIASKQSGHIFTLPEINSKTSGSIIFLFGLITGIHCVGMCGGFVIGHTIQVRSLFHSHILYGVGKTLSYTLIGAFFGLIGSFFKITPFISGLTIFLGGVFLIFYGVGAIRTVRFNHCTINKQQSKRGPFLIGLFSGLLLGCGPLQMMYLLATVNGDPIEGAKILFLFGLGTLPFLLGFGLFTRLLSQSMTRHFVQTSGIILILMGGLMLNKGFMRIKSVNTVQAHGHHKAL